MFKDWTLVILGENPNLRNFPRCRYTIYRGLFKEKKDKNVYYTSESLVKIRWNMFSKYIMICDMNTLILEMPKVPLIDLKESRKTPIMYDRDILLKVIQRLDPVEDTLHKKYREYVESRGLLELSHLYRNDFSDHFLHNLDSTSPFLIGPRLINYDLPEIVCIANFKMDSENIKSFQNQIYPNKILLLPDGSDYVQEDNIKYYKTLDEIPKNKWIAEWDMDWYSPIRLHLQYTESLNVDGTYFSSFYVVNNSKMAMKSGIIHSLMYKNSYDSKSKFRSIDKYKMSIKLTKITEDMELLDDYEHICKLMNRTFITKDVVVEHRFDMKLFRKMCTDLNAWWIAIFIFIVILILVILFILGYDKLSSKMKL